MSRLIGQTCGCSETVGGGGGTERRRRDDENWVGGRKGGGEEREEERVEVSPDTAGDYHDNLSQ